MSLIFIKETHDYILDGTPVPSVTQLLKPINNSVYEDIDPAILNRAAERGTAVHKATENIDKGIQFEFCEEWLGYLEAYNKFKQEHDTSWLNSECPLASRENSYAGTVDRIGNVDGEISILDVKTTHKIHDKLVIPQLTFYKMLAEENNVAEIDKLYILKLTKTGEYTLKEFNQNKKLANALLLIHQYKEGKMK